MIVELVKLGFLGFATAILILSYLLLQKVMASKDFEGENLTIRCREIRLFMLMSFGVILVGMTWDLLDPKINIKFDVTPEEIAHDLVVKAAGKKVDINGEDVPMQDENEVSINLFALYKRLNFMESSSAGASNELKNLKARQAQNIFHEAGQTEEAGI
ncbi:hypothetical protein GCAAIG_12320 [Candidatus Electronema halotolerans]